MIARARRLSDNSITWVVKGHVRRGEGGHVAGCLLHRAECVSDRSDSVQPARCGPRRRRQITFERGAHCIVQEDKGVVVAYESGQNLVVDQRVMRQVRRIRFVGPT
jgi:hypothetical protein